MATKLHTTSNDSAGSSVLAQFPPPISLSSPVLASVIYLPDHPLFAYAIFTGAPYTNVADHLNLIELARRKILTQNGKRAILDSLLPSVHIIKDSTALYVFAFGSADRISDPQVALQALQFEGLSLTDSSTFTTSSIYPCSITCSSQAIPCAECLNTFSKTLSNVFSATHLLPRKPLRLPFHHFLTAVRDRLIDDITEASKLTPQARQATRLQGGFLLGPTASSSNWGTGWEHRARSRPLLYCHLQIHLSQVSNSTRLLIHPVLRPTFYLPLYGTLPLPSGSPITLLPHGVPGFYLNTYKGPASALTSQFDDALLGLGAGDWKGYLSESAEQVNASASTSTSSEKVPTYIIAWLAIQNIQGEDKGMPIIWPVRLCLSYHPSSPSPHARTPLSYNPELPTQLQASPPLPAQVVPPGLANAKSGLSLSMEGATHANTPSQPLSAHPELEHASLSSPIGRRPQTITSSPTTESLRSFRALTLSASPYSRNVRQVAAEVSGYVDSVAKERERERERMKREREGASGRGRAASINGPAPASSTSTAPELPSHDAMEVVKADSPIGESESEPHVDTSPMEQDAETAPPSSQNSLNSLFSPPAGASTPSPPDDSTQIVTDAKLGNELISLDALPVPSEVRSSGGSPGLVPYAYDLFNGLDNPSWGQPSSGFLDINMGFDVGFNMHMGTLGDSREGRVSTGAFDIDDGFGDFTDDDFKFFDAPTAQTHPTSVSMPSTQTDVVMKAIDGLTPSAGPAPLGFSPQRASDAMYASGPGPPSIAFSQSSPWVPQHSDGFTPRPIDLHYLSDGIPPAPDLLPPSPTKTPSSHSAPTTPIIQLADHHDLPERQKSNCPSSGPKIFDPIPFAPSHRAADGKYAIGKFALSSPADIEDRTEAMGFPSSAPSATGGWKYKYSAATDPRIGVMRKLIGVKRKSFDQGMRHHRIFPAWVREHEEWESKEPTYVADDTNSDGDSEDEEPWVVDDDDMTISRPSTPPPSYLPLGPTLLQTHFHHSRLLPLSSPLRPPGASVSSSNSSAAPVSVPTPVSPAAVLGVASERSKSLEAAAQLLGREIVENAIWADAWRSSAAMSSRVLRPPTEIWQADVKRVGHLLEKINKAGTPVDLQMLSSLDSVSSEDNSSDSLRPLQPPVLTVGKSESVIHILPAAIRFWEKLGLAPRAGQKDVVAYVFYEARDEKREVQIAQWLDRVSLAYSARNLGKHVAGSSGNSSRRGLVPVQFDQTKKTLVNFISTLNPFPKAHLVLYIVTPPSVDTPTSSTLRPLFSAIKRAQKTYPDAGILFHLVPEALISGGSHDSRALHGGLEVLVSNVYDRIPELVDRVAARKLPEDVTQARMVFHAPAFVLSSGGPDYGPYQSPKITFALEAHPNSLDVVDKYSFLHVAYRISSCRQWLLAACVDVRGEEHDLGAWLLPAESPDTFIVSQVWSFVRMFAARASIEWRITLAKLGAMKETELDAWMSHLHDVVSNSSDIPLCSISLLAVDHENAWILVPPESDVSMKTTAVPISRPTPRTPSGVVLAEAGARTYMLSPPPSLVCMPTLKTPCTSPYGSADRPFIPDSEDEEPSLQQQPHLRVRAKSTLIHESTGCDHSNISMVHVYLLHSIQSRPTPATSMLNDPTEPMLREIVLSFHALAELVHLRWRSNGFPGLPLHLRAVEIMNMALAGESPADPC